MTAFRYDGRTVVITGASTGMGNETTRMLLDAGATVHAIDIADVDLEVASVVRADLGDRSSIDEALGRLPDQIDVLMNCAGIPGGTRFTPVEVMQVNFIGLRHLTEALLPRIASGGSVVNIASIAGAGWMSHVTELGELLGAADFDDAVAWLDGKDELIGDGYFFSKEALQFYTMATSVRTIKNGVRMNSICPGVTDTKIMPDFRSSMGDAAIEMTAGVGIGRLAEPSEMAPGMIFLGSTEASYVNGINLVIDGGFTAGMMTGQVDFADYGLG